jgi:myo-inositol 2-dehydrogenase/D-chiro-inositol 1-dehydrogenase
MRSKLRIGIIGFGRMGKLFLAELMKSCYWDVAYICDTNPIVLEQAKDLSPNSIITSNENDIFNDSTVDAVGLFTLANKRKSHIEKAIKARKHIIAEKPIADTVHNEQEVVRLVESSGLFSTVNLSLRNAWYHNEIKNFILKGEIGEVAIIRVCHMTPGLAPGEGHEFEGPSFHDCGMHYVDIARWYAESEFKTYHAQAIRMWNYKDPWWLQCHGTFDNGIVFDITQGHVYGQLAKDLTHNSFVDIIGTKGVARMGHDFHTAIVELHGITETMKIEKSFGDKNIGILCNNFASSILSQKRHKGLPNFKDAAIASNYAWQFIHDALKNDISSRGTFKELEDIWERRSKLKNGYGLL